MLFLIVLMVLLSPLGIALYVQTTVHFTNQQQLTIFSRQTTPQELFPTDAITMDLAPLDEMITNMHAFVDAAKVVYTEYFVDNHFNAADIPGPWMSEIYTVHDYLLNVIRFEIDADLTSCTFSHSGIDLCDDSEASMGSIRAILHSEIVRTRACAATISKVYEQATGLGKTFRIALQHLQLMRELFHAKFPQPYAESVAPGAEVPLPEFLSQHLHSRTRVLGLDHEFQLLLLSSKAYLPTCYNLTDFEYLKTLQTVFLEAGQIAETTSNMECWMLFSGHHSAAMADYRAMLCHQTRGQLPAHDASPASVRAETFKKVKWW
jgi:hypothetical protein